MAERTSGLMDLIKRCGLYSLPYFGMERDGLMAEKRVQRRLAAIHCS